jgi:hypothetical protein
MFARSGNFARFIILTVNLFPHLSYTNITRFVANYLLIVTSSSFLSPLLLQERYLYDLTSAITLWYNFAVSLSENWLLVTELLSTLKFQPSVTKHVNTVKHQIFSTSTHLLSHGGKKIGQVGSKGFTQS